MIAKVAFGKEIHLFRGQTSLGELKKYCRSAFKGLTDAFQFFYCDIDGDRITVSTQQDLDILMDSEQAIKKIFIEQCEAEFESLDLEPNPEQQSTSLQSQPIKTINIVKQKLSAKKKETQTIRRVVDNYLSQLENDIANQLIKDEGRLIQQQVNSFVSQMHEKVIVSILQEENKIISEEVKVFMQSIIQEQVSTLATSSIEKGVQTNMQPKQQNNQQSINQMVDDRIKQLLPSIVKQVYRAVQARIKINGSGKCTNCCEMQIRCLKLYKKAVKQA